MMLFWNIFLELKYKSNGKKKRDDGFPGTFINRKLQITYELASKVGYELISVAPISSSRVKLKQDIG